jgi:hypothetical protein
MAVAGVAPKARACQSGMSQRDGFGLRLMRLYPLCEIHHGLHERPSVDRLGQVQLKPCLDRLLTVLLSRE